MFVYSVQAVEYAPPPEAAGLRNLTHDPILTKMQYTGVFCMKILYFQRNSCILHEIEGIYAQKAARSTRREVGARRTLHMRIASR